MKDLCTQGQGEALPLLPASEKPLGTEVAPRAVLRALCPDISHQRARPHSQHPPPPKLEEPETDVKSLPGSSWAVVPTPPPLPLATGTRAILGKRG